MGLVSMRSFWEHQRGNVSGAETVLEHTSISKEDGGKRRASRAERALTTNCQFWGHFLSRTAVRIAAWM